MKRKMYLMMLAALLAVSVANAGMAVISINIESKTAGSPYNPMFGDTAGSFITGTSTEWNRFDCGDADGYAYSLKTGVLGTMDGSATQNDVKFQIVGSEGKVGRSWTHKTDDYIFCQDGGSNIIDAYEFSYTGLIAGESYDLLFRVNRSYTQVTIDGVSKVSSFDTNMLTFNGAVADATGTIIGDLREAPGQSADKLYWMQIQGEFVPEPATLALLGLGGLFLRRRKA